MNKSLVLAALVAVVALAACGKKEVAPVAAPAAAVAPVVVVVPAPAPADAAASAATMAASAATGAASAAVGAMGAAKDAAVVAKDAAGAAGDAAKKAAEGGFFMGDCFLTNQAVSQGLPSASDAIKRSSALHDMALARLFLTSSGELFCWLKWAATTCLRRLCNTAPAMLDACELARCP